MMAALTTVTLLLMDAFLNTRLVLKKCSRGVHSYFAAPALRNVHLANAKPYQKIG